MEKNNQKNMKELTDDEKYLIVRYMGYIIKGDISESKEIIKEAENIIKKLDEYGWWKK